eukprot:COSAG06_NODE_17986_length_909_cov_147.408642_2_plen_43_part_01
MRARQLRHCLEVAVWQDDLPPAAHHGLDDVRRGCVRWVLEERR